MKIKIIIALLLLAFFMIGCSEQPLTVEGAYVCKSINENNSPDELPNIFPADITDIYLSVKIKNITPDDQLKVKWTYLDTGDVIEEQTSRVESKGSGYISFNISISEGFPAGNYKAEVFLNQELTEEINFSVQ